MIKFMQRCIKSVFIHAQTHLKGQEKVDRQVSKSKKGGESAGENRASWKEEEKMEVQRAGKQDRGIIISREEEKQGNIRPQQLE